jgi:hypothetical protein
MPTTIISSFDTIDMAENAARIIKDKVQEIISITLIDNRRLTDEPAYYMTMLPTTFFSGTIPPQTSQLYAPFMLNQNESPYDEKHYYFEPIQRGDTILKINVQDDYAHIAENLLRSIGGQKISTSHYDSDKK